MITQIYVYSPTLNTTGVEKCARHAVAGGVGAPICRHYRTIFYSSFSFFCSGRKILLHHAPAAAKKSLFLWNSRWRTELFAKFNTIFGRNTVGKRELFVFTTFDANFNTKWKWIADARCVYPNNQYWKRYMIWLFSKHWIFFILRHL